MCISSSRVRLGILLVPDIWTEPDQKNFNRNQIKIKNIWMNIELEKFGYPKLIGYILYSNPKYSNIYIGKPKPTSPILRSSLRFLFLRHWKKIVHSWILVFSSFLYVQYIQKLIFMADYKKESHDLCFLLHNWIFKTIKIFRCMLLNTIFVKPKALINFEFVLHGIRHSHLWIHCSVELQKTMKMNHRIFF